MAVEIIIVLGNRNPQIMKKRVDRALEHFFSSPQTHEDGGIIKYLLFSGGSSDGVSKPEGAVMMEYYSMNSVDSKCILVEKKSRDTVQNLLFSKQIVEKMFPATLDVKPRLTICTSSFHIKRSIVMAKLLLGDYPLGFIHTNEPISAAEYQREATILNNFLDAHIQHYL